MNYQDENIKNMLEGTFDKLDSHESKLKNFLNKRAKNNSTTPQTMP